jgi:hypothetical protein
VLREAERLGSQLPLFRVVATMDNAKASDPRDYIYGFLGVSRFEIAIDYSRSVEDLYCEFSAGWMEWETLQTASDEPGVSPLMYAGIGFRSQLASLPSWTADLSALGNRRSRWSGHYSPAGKSHIKMAHPTIHGKILRLRGIIVDKIIGIYAWPDGDVMAGIFAIIESLLQDVSELSDGAFLQTLFRTFMYDKRADGLSDLEPGSVYYFEFMPVFSPD